MRDPDYGGWTGWFNYLTNGYSQTYILNQFLASPEFQSQYAGKPSLIRKQRLSALETSPSNILTETGLDGRRRL